MTPLPFSGLSLIVHLGIIAVAWIVRLSGFKVTTRNRTTSSAWHFPKSVLSMIILLFISSVMTTFVWIAITTGVREGSTEWHRILFSEAVSSLEERGVVRYQSVADRITQ